MLYMPYPFKRCTKCGREYPSTLEYFHYSADNMTRLRANCKVCDRARHRAYRLDNPEKVKENKRKYEQTHREFIVSQRHRYNQEHGAARRQYARDYRKAHQDQRQEYEREYKHKNRKQANVWERNRKAKKRALVTTFTVDDWIFALDWFDGVCAYCGHGPTLFDRYKTLQQEHHIPISRGGNSTPDNIVPACQSCNVQKNNREPSEWLRERFGAKRASKIAKQIREFFDCVRC